MAKPVTLPVWATDGGTTLEPSAGEKAAGWALDQKPPARWLNWWQNNVYAWAVYLNGLPTDDDFRNANFTWGGSHVFSAAITVPASSGIATASTDRTVIIPITSWMPHMDNTGLAQWRLNTPAPADAPYWEALAVNTYISCCLDGILHDGQQIKTVELLVDPAAARAVTGERMQANLFRTDFNFTTPGIATGTVEESDYDDGTTAFQEILMGSGSSYTVNRGLNHQILSVRSGSSTVGDRLYAARVTVSQTTINSW